MRTRLSELLDRKHVLLADGATGTNYFQAGLASGEPPEFWTIERPQEVVGLHQRFVDAGADIILTNTFGCNPHRLKLHKAEHRTYELAKRAAELARSIADGASRPIVVAGSVGPTGELFEPLGKLTHEAAVTSFRVQLEGLRDGGADVAWIETMSAPEEASCAAEAAIAVGLPYVITYSFDTAGRTMMGLLPSVAAATVAAQAIPPLAIGANCGVGAPDILVSLIEMRDAPFPLITKGNCGVPHFEGTEAVYSGTPEMMANYARLAIDAGARIIGGCCGTTPAHVAAMRASIDAHERGNHPTLDRIVTQIGPLANAPPAENARRPARRPRR
ncbi:MAG TPA: betaine--homocysteine S-methyltransferase [Steroidobacteraceae bacterium]|jgi:5-methyltetrahydrofolate--homocysteine methyltransferase|nr:betaine--homocysteine S-methyltransferase [Steroidobacteraceae bacterium]